MLQIWVIYRHPADHPGKYVARLWVGEQPTTAMLIAEALEPLQDEMMAMGLVKLMPSPGDDPVIVETWL